MAAAVCGTASAKLPTAQETRRAIENVNTQWQKNNPPECRAFWDNAAYHTGNMEAYRLTGNQDFLDYSRKWAEHNEWKGAKGTDRSKWKYDTYGEDEDHVMFGDWQICFQTYADLYNILPDDRYIRRAKEEMEHQMSTPQNDYWWWADGLYMVMPVMTKMYNITRNQKYLDKLYEYIQVSDSIMLDPETGLYFRDGKYVYPKHKSVNGKKDFWARGDGWFLAGLAKVLADVPANWKHRKFFEDKYVKLAEGVGNGQARAALTAVMHRMFDGMENFNEKGYLTIGFAGRQPNVADWYTNNGSMYMTSLAFMPLGLPATHPFWTDAAQPWTQVKAWNGDPFPKDHHWNDDIRTWDLF